MKYGLKFQYLLLSYYIMLKYNRFDISYHIDINITTDLEEYRVSHYCFFFQNNFFVHQSLLCSGCHDLSQTSVSFNDFSIVTFKRNDYRVTFGP